MAATDPGRADFLEPFSDPQAVARYADGPRRFVPGLDALHVMTGILLAEQVPDDASILVLGAGGGLEMAALAAAHPGWRFVGVDPAAEMLRLAARTNAAHRDRVTLIEGYVDDAPDGPFDGAVCLLTLHFLDAAERQRTVAGLHRRLKPGAPFVAAHSSFPQDADARDRWLDRYAAFPVALGFDRAAALGARTAVAAHLESFSPAQDEAIFAAAGFRDVTLFYTAFTWRGWVAYA